MMLIKWGFRAGLAAMALALLVEIGLRVFGVIDIPLYGHDDKLGYWVLPAQHGKFLNKNDWYVNDIGMPVEKDFKSAIDQNHQNHQNLMVIGNSVIMGGNAYQQKDKIAPLVQQKLGGAFNVWPVAVGGWSNVNEAEYLHQHPDVVKHTDFFVWEVMQGAFSDLSRWRGDTVFPSHRPDSALWYSFQHYVVPRLVADSINELPPDGGINAAYFASFNDQLGQLVQSTHSTHPGILLLYPTQVQLKQARAGKEWLPEQPLVEQLARQYHLRIVDVAKDPRWNVDCYRDGVHPTAQANQILADMLAEAVNTYYLPAVAG